jgi:hypothetical protein
MSAGDAREVRSLSPRRAAPYVGISAVALFAGCSYPTSPSGNAGVDAGAFGVIGFEMLNSDAGTFSAAFYARREDSPGQSTVGPCSVFFGEAHPSTLSSAGTLRVAGGGLGDGGILLEPSAGGAYDYKAPSLFAAGDTLRVSGAGGEVPAFGEQNVIAPEAITLTTPMPGGALFVDTSTDLVVSWTGGVAGAQVGIELVGQQRFGYVSQALCVFDAVATPATIPKGALANFVGGETSGAAYATQRRSAAFTVGPYAITLNALAGKSYPANFHTCQMSVEFDDPSCTSCAASHCCTEANTCFGTQPGTDCEQLHTCARACVSKAGSFAAATPCMQDCVLAHPAAQADWTAYVTCADNNCRSECF